jgi:hypothetical protein
MECGVNGYIFTMSIMQRWVKSWQFAGVGSAVLYRLYPYLIYPGSLAEQSVFIYSHTKRWLRIVKIPLAPVII